MSGSSSNIIIDDTGINPLTALNTQMASLLSQMTALQAQLTTMQGEVAFLMNNPFGNGPPPTPTPTPTPTPAPTPTPTPTPAPTPTPTPVPPTLTVLTPGSTATIKDVAGNVWNLSAAVPPSTGGAAYEKIGTQAAQPVPGGGGTDELTVLNGVIWGRDATTKRWWSYVNGSWILQTAPPPGLPAGK